jgi:hypothetical protein
MPGASKPDFCGEKKIIFQAIGQFAQGPASKRQGPHFLEAALGQARHAAEGALAGNRGGNMISAKAVAQAQ